MTFNILVTDPLNEDGIQILLKDDRFNVSIATSLTETELFKEIKKTDALLVRSQTTVSKELIESAPNLKIIGRAGVGIDNIDLDAATENGVIVVNAPGGNTNSAAEHTIAMMMSLSRNIPQSYRALQNKEWNRGKYIGIEVKNKTIGIIGFGHVGQEVAHRAKGQRMQVIVQDPFLTEERAAKHGVELGTTDDILEKADFITVHTPLIKATKHLLNKEAFAKAKKGVRIINCARGGIIDEQALYEAIEDGIVAGAALDVFETEPAINNPLLNLPQVIATPHLGGSTVEAQRNVAADISVDVRNYLTGGAVEHPVNLPSVSKETMHKVIPYVDLAEKLGVFLSEMQQNTIKEIEICFKGKLEEREIEPITRSAVKGILKRFYGNEVNVVNSLYLAEQREIEIHEKRTQSKQKGQETLTLSIKTNKGTQLVTGAIYEGFGERIIQIDEYRIDMIPKGHALIIQHEDKPGVIGNMGSVLGKHNVNIATMQVDRTSIGGNAMMLLTIDKHPSDSALEDVLKLSDIVSVIPIDF